MHPKEEGEEEEEGWSRRTGRNQVWDLVLVQIAEYYMQAIREVGQPFKIGGHSHTLVAPLHPLLPEALEQCDT